MPTGMNTELGEIKISEQVIATVAGVSAMESYGIVGMAAKNATDGLFEILKMDSITKGIDVKVEDNRLIIDLHVILEYGVKISVVADNIIDRVKFNVEKLTGQDIDKINVFVQGIRVGK